MISSSVDPNAWSLPNGYHLLRAVTPLSLPIREVFPFFAAAENLERITPPELRFRIVSPLPISMEEGTLIDYRIRLNGLPFGWRTEITEWDPPFAFTDTQVRGPYHTWVHRHTFLEVDGGTLMVDEVRYRLPLWPLSGVALPLVREKLRRIFTYRGRVMEGLLMPSGGDSLTRDRGGAFTPPLTPRPPLTHLPLTAKIPTQFDSAGGSSRKPVKIRRGPATVRGPS